MSQLLQCQNWLEYPKSLHCLAHIENIFIYIFKLLMVNIHEDQ